jgi:hypothetical protein
MTKLLDLMDGCTLHSINHKGQQPQLLVLDQNGTNKGIFANSNGSLYFNHGSTDRGGRKINLTNILKDNGINFTGFALRVLSRETTTITVVNIAHNKVTSQEQLNGGY